MHHMQQTPHMPDRSGRTSTRKPRLRMHITYFRLGTVWDAYAERGALFLTVEKEGLVEALQQVADAA